MNKDSDGATTSISGVICSIIYVLIYNVGLKPVVVNKFGSLAAQVPELTPLFNLIPELFDILSPDPMALFLHILIGIWIGVMYFGSK